MNNSKHLSIEGRSQVRSTPVGVRISSVLPESLAEAIGLKTGDVLEYINGEPIRDPIDYRFHMSDEEVIVEVRRADDVLVFDIEKDLEDDLGVELEEMPILKCDNKCVFCFLHQMPKGMRKTLYYQDDDYRLSFLHGAYVTLTNLSDHEFQRIMDQRLSPMYISVHATDPTLRAELLGRPDPTPVLDRIDQLAKAGIQMHTQVVLCPGLNDGSALKKTVFDLAQKHPAIESIGVVPLGLTRFRKNLPELKPLGIIDAEMAIQQVDEWQKTFKKRLGTRFVYLGDEFFLMAGKTIPPKRSYEGFPLVENGIGMVRRFVDSFHSRVSELDQLPFSPLRLVLITGILGSQFLAPLVARLNQVNWISARLVSVVNHFLGEGITVSGLLTGQDIFLALQKACLSGNEIVLLPPNCINHNGLFIDDGTPSDLGKKLGCRILVGSYDLVESVFNVVDGISGQPGSGSDVVLHPYISSHQVGG